MRRLLLLLVVLLAVPVSPASAQSPNPCGGSGFTVTATWTPRRALSGQTSTLKVVATQSGTGCDVTGMTITLAMPGANGEPGAATTVADNQTYPYNMAPKTLAETPYTVNVNPGVTFVKARIVGSGRLQDSAPGSPLPFDQTITLPVIAPKLGLTVTPDPTTGAAPLSVTYRFTLTNLGSAADSLRDAAIGHPASCVPAYEGGDTNADTFIGAGEIWRYSCTRVYPTAGENRTTWNATALAVADGAAVAAGPLETVVQVAPPSPSGHLTLTTVANPANGFAPLNVTYTYTVTNDGTGPVRNVTVADAGCSPVTTTAAGDLAAGASRTFTCSRLFDTVATFNAGAIANGVDVNSGQGVSTAQVTTAVTTTASPTATAAATTSPEPEPEPEATPTPAATPQPTFRPSARVSFTTRGRFARPCRGKIAFALKAGGRTIARKSARPGRGCRYTVRFEVARSRLGKAKKVTITARLGHLTRGQDFLVPR